MKLSRGALYMVASAFGFSVMAMLVKVATHRLPIGEIVFARAVVTLVLSYAMVRRANLSTWGTRKGALVFRGFLGFGGLTGYYLAIAHLPLADATTIQNATPLLTALLAWWLLDEAIGWSTAFALACGIAGVLLIVHPSGAGLDPVGVGFALGAVCCSSTAYVTVRKLARTEHPLVIVYYFPLVAAPLALPWALYDLVMPSALDWLILITMGAATQMGQVFLTKALAVERAGKVTVVGYTQVAFAMAWQIAVFGDLPTGWTIAGASLILGGTLVVAQMKRLPLGRSTSAAARTPTTPAP